MNRAVTTETDDIILKTFTQEANPSQLINYLHKNYPGGNYIIGYESGYFGLNLYRYLKEKTRMTSQRNMELILSGLVKNLTVISEKMALMLFNTTENIIGRMIGQNKLFIF